MDKMMFHDRVMVATFATVAIALAIMISMLGLNCIAFAVESSGDAANAASASAASATATSTSSASASATSATATKESAESASGSSAAAEPTGHQSIVYATDETKTASEQIEDDENALSSGVTSTWSIIDLACAIANLAFCIALLGDTARRRVAGFVSRGRTIMGGVSAVLALVSVFVLAMTQDFAMPASVADELSFLFVALLVVQVILFAVAKLGKSRDGGNIDVDMAGFAA